MRKIILILSVFYNTEIVCCQEEKLSEAITAVAEQLAAEVSDPAAAEIFLERLFELAEERVLINSADEKEISRLFFLSDFQVKVLTDYIKTSGGIVSFFEIANIPGFDKETAELLIPFITLENRSGTLNKSARFRYTVLSNFICKSTATDTASQGSPWKILTKYKFTTGSFSGGFTTEKDPCEKMFYGNPPVPDFFSAYLTYKGNGFVKRIVIGDYSARFGQGTNINTGIRTGLSLTAPGYLSGRDEIKPYTSTEENNFFRGIAAELRVKNFDMSLFFSTNKIDATLNESVDSAGLSVMSFNNTGLHNTKGNIAGRDVVTETVYGSNLSYNFNNLRIGMLWSENRFSLPVIHRSLRPADIYDFKGNKNDIFSIYYNWLFKRFILYGELSYTEINKYAFVQGVSFRPDERLSINFIYRNYSSGYASFHGNGTAVTSLNSNEYGIIGNFTLEAARFLFISAGSDIRYYPWLRYKCSIPSMAKRYEIRIKYLPSDRIILETIYNCRYTLTDNNDDHGISKQDDIVTQYVRGSLKYSPEENITFGTRIDYKTVSPSGSKGLLLLQEIIFKSRIIPFSLWMRYCVFSTGGFDSGIYTWENDLLNSFSIPVLYGEGNRTYLMASWKMAGKAELRIKLAATISEVNQNLKDTKEIRIQLKVSI